jgi:hypothetical protein
MRLIFDLNVLERTAKNQWNSSNAEMLLKYAVFKNYSQNLDLELGNGMYVTFYIYVVVFVLLATMKNVWSPWVTGHQKLHSLLLALLFSSVLFINLQYL